MNFFKQLSTYIEGRNWSSLDSEYSPSELEMKGVIRWVKLIAMISREKADAEVAHIFSSPASQIGVVVPEDVINEIELRISRINDFYAKIIVKNALEWSYIATEKQLPEFFPHDLFNPLLSLIENGCRFKIRKGYLEVGDKAIPLHLWPAI